MPAPSGRRFNACCGGRGQLGGGCRIIPGDGDDDIDPLLYGTLPCDMTRTKYAPLPSGIRWCGSTCRLAVWRWVRWQKIQCSGNGSPGWPFDGVSGPDEIDARSSLAKSSGPTCRFSQATGVMSRGMVAGATASKAVFVDMLLMASM